MEFWFDFASTYSYLSALRIENLANDRGIEVIWKPFLLGPIFAEQGLDSSPFVENPIKGQYMFQDVLRQSEKYGLNFQIPGSERLNEFPQNSVLAARLALLALDQDMGVEYCKAVFKSQFEERQNIANPEVILECLDIACLPPELIEQAVEPENKLALRKRVETAFTYKIFGAPTFVVGDQIFWGDDRLEDALSAARHQA